MPDKDRNILPPQNIEAEQSTLGAMMLDNSALQVGLDILKASDFYRPVHREIFSALAEMHRKNEPVDIITFSEELRKRGQLDDVGGADYLLTLVETVPTAANIEHHAGIVEQKSLLRDLIAAGTSIVAMGHQETMEIPELLEKAEQIVLKIGQRRSGANFRWMSEIYHDVFNQLPRLSEEFGIPIGLKPLADHCIKFMPGECIVIGARPSVGKSALAYQLLEHAAKNGHKSAIISCEMTAEQFALRQFAGAADVLISTVIRGNLSESDYARIAESASDLRRHPVAFCDAIGRKMAEIKVQARRLYAEGVRLIAIDHIHCVQADNPQSSRAAQLGQISADCKRIARELNIPVLALAQLSRGHLKDNKDARPSMADLKESGDIEANSDVILLLWRPAAECERRSYGVTPAEIGVVKHRQLGTGKIKCGFYGRKFRFVDTQENTLPLEDEEADDKPYYAQIVSAPRRLVANEEN